MKKIICLTFALAILQVSAADLIVQESGPVGTYSSINAAVTAASSGDRIVINNKIGNVPWMENVVINKSLEFISAVPDTFFIVQGNYTVSLTTPGVVTIIGMKNISGGLSATADAAAGARTIVNLFASYFSSGGVNFAFNNYDCNISGNYIHGNVNFCYGKVIANYMVSQNNQITLSSDAIATNDTVFIIANKDMGRISSNTTSQFYYIANNAVNNSSAGYGIIANDGKNSTLSENMILNNSVATVSGISVYLNTNTKTNVINNIVYGNIVAFNKTGSGSILNLNISYNAMMAGGSNFTGGIVNNGTNFNSTFGNICTGTPLSSNQNNGHPDPIYSDLDLTRSEVGALGGSFTLANFYNPICSNFSGGKARLWFLLVPRRVIQGNTININANGYDR